MKESLGLRCVTDKVLLLVMLLSKQNFRKESKVYDKRRKEN